jgi:hypothetical protein
MRRSIRVAVGLFGLAALAVGGLPASADAAPPPAPAAQGCDRPTGGTAGHGDKTVTVCLRHRPAAAAKGDRAAGPAIRGAALGVIDQCQQSDAFPPIWYQDRTEACFLGYARALVRSRDLDGAVIGYIDYHVTMRAFTSLSSGTWTMDADLVVERAVDFLPRATAGTLAWGSFSCSPSCLNATFFPAQPVGFDGATAHGHMEFQSLVNLGDVAWGGMTGIISFGSLDITPDELTIPNEGVRCDNATLGRFDIGCIYTDAWPISFPASISQQYPDFAHHIRDAMNSGLPGSPQSFRPLHRLTDPLFRDRNGNTACPPGWKRGDFMSCDEYPFRSTYEGAWFEKAGGFSGRTFDWCGVTQLPQGVTGQRGWSSCFINDRQNSFAGGALGNWYTKNRIINGEPFFVEIP